MPKNKPNVFDAQDITADEFFSTHWQRSPYLFRNTGIDLSCLPDSAAMFALAAEEGVQSRIVYTEDQTRFQAIYDEPEAWNEVAHHNPTLLVSDIEKWYPEAQQLMAWFPFIKSWRFDDLMMSFAPKGASVGAHTDHYDVLLLQVQGSRKWSYDQQALVNPTLIEGSELAVLDGFKAEVSVELKAGDMLYLPPEIPHHGTSTSDDCITCSIGLRAPSDAELLTNFIELATSKMPEHQRFKDGVKHLNSDASIGSHEINHLRQQLTHLSQLDEAQLANLFGQVVTSYRLFDDGPETPMESINTNQHRAWEKNPFAVFAYHANDAEAATLFVNGEAFATSLMLAKKLCDQASFQWSELKQQVRDPMAELRVLHQLVDLQVLIPV